MFNYTFIFLIFVSPVQADYYLKNSSFGTPLTYLDPIPSDYTFQDILDVARTNYLEEKALEGKYPVPGPTGLFTDNFIHGVSDLSLNVSSALTQSRIYLMTDTVPEPGYSNYAKFRILSTKDCSTTFNDIVVRTPSVNFETVPFEPVLCEESCGYAISVEFPPEHITSINDVLTAQCTIYDTDPSITSFTQSDITSCINPLKTLQIVTYTPTGVQCNPDIPGLDPDVNNVPGYEPLPMLAKLPVDSFKNTGYKNPLPDTKPPLPIPPPTVINITNTYNEYPSYNSNVTVVNMSTNHSDYTVVQGQLTGGQTTPNPGDITTIPSPGTNTDPGGTTNNYYSNFDDTNIVNGLNNVNSSVNGVKNSVDNLNTTIGNAFDSSGLPVLNDAPILEDTLDGLLTGISSAPISLAILNVANIVTLSAPSCEPLTFDFEELLGVSPSTNIHCELYPQATSIISPIMLVIWSLIGFRIFASA